jgi:glucosamine kinase
VSLNEEDARFVIAADAGGTFSRVACFSLDGRLLGFATGKGGSPYHQADAAKNVADTTTRALLSGGLEASNAIKLVAGLAMVSRSGSNQGDGNNDWAEDFFQVPGLDCERLVLNDAVIAHRGALQGRPGIIVVAGTGSMILAIDKDGVEVESGQFEHYAGAARHLVYEAVQLILTGTATAADDGFVASALAHWGAVDVPSLRRALLQLATADRMQVRHHYGAFAPVVTEAAATSPLADQALRDLALKTARGIRLLVPLIGESDARVATTGGLASTLAFTGRLADALGTEPTSSAVLVPPALDPLRGAAVIAYQRAGIGVDDELLGQLRDSQVQRAL